MGTCSVEGCGIKSWAKGLCGKHYAKQRYIKNPEKIRQQKREYYLLHKEYLRQQAKEWRHRNKDKVKQQSRRYYLKNGEEIKQRVREYCLLDKGKVCQRDKNYKLNHKAEISQQGKEYYRENKEKIRQYYNQWRVTPDGKVAMRKSYGKRKQLGFDPLNNPFPNCEGHHIDRVHIIYIPVEVHKSVSHSLFNGRNMVEINKLAFEYLEREQEGKQNILVT